MQKPESAGAGWATRFLLFLIAAALCSMIVSQPVSAQTTPDPSITLTVEKTSFCPGEAKLPVDFTATASTGVGSVLVTLKSDDNGTEFSSNTVIDSMQETFTDTVVFELPDVAATGNWTVTATVTDSTNKTAMAEQKVALIAIADCGATGAEIRTVTMSGPVCPDPATMSVDYVAFANLSGIDRVEIAATSDANPVGFKQQVVIGDGQVNKIERTATFEIPADTPTSTWDVTVTVNDKDAQMVTQQAVVDVVANPGCERQAPKLTLGKVALSGSVCPDPAKLTVPFVAEAEAGIVQVSVDATSDGNAQGIGAAKDFDPAEKKVDDSIVVDIPADTPSGKWTVEVTALDALNESTKMSASVDLVAKPGCVSDGPVVKIEDVKVSGPLCPAGAAVSANVVLDNIEGSVTLTGSILGPDGYLLKADPVTVKADGTRQTVPWSIDLPVDAPDGKLSVVVQAAGTTWSTVTATSFMVERGADACVADPGVAVHIDTVEVCPSIKAVIALVSAKADKGLKSVVVRSDLFPAPQSAPIIAGDKTAKKSVVFAIPASAKPGTYQLVAEATDASGNTSLDYKDFTLGSVDDCKPIDPGGIDPNKPATPTPNPVTPTPTPGISKPTPTPDVSKPMTPTPTPTLNPGDIKKPGDTGGTTGGKPGNLAFTGRNSVALALGGVMLIVTGVAVAWDPRTRSFGRRR